MTETATTEELLDALRAAGVDLDRIEVPDESYDVAGAQYERYVPFMARRDDGEVLYFEPSESLEGEEPEGWTWAEWNDGECLADGWESDLTRMVAWVVRFLSTEVAR